MQNLNKKLSSYEIIFSQSDFFTEFFFYVKTPLEQILLSVKKTYAEEIRNRLDL